MPNTNPAADDWWSLRQQDLAWQVRAIAHQQQYTCSDAQGRPVINMGLIPGSNPAMYGLQFINPATGIVVGEFVFNSQTGLVAQQYFNASGQLASQIDANGSHYYDTSGNEVVRLDATGLHVFNSAAQEEVRAGLLNTSPAIYGLGVAPSTGGSPGTLQQVGGILTSGPYSASNVTNTAWVTFAGASTITAEIGPSGLAEVTLSGRISTGVGGQAGYIGVSIDGGAPSSVEVAGINGAGGLTVFTSTSIVVSLGANATHTFVPQYETASNGAGNVSFSNVTLTVQPL